MTSAFHNDTKFCPCCSKYVNFLSSIELSYCIECGAQCEMFSEADRLAFNEKMAARKPKGGRPSKNARREVAAASRAAA